MTHLCAAFITRQNNAMYDIACLPAIYLICYLLKLLHGIPFDYYIFCKFVDRVTPSWWYVQRICRNAHTTKQQNTHRNPKRSGSDLRPAGGSGVSRYRKACDKSYA